MSKLSLSDIKPGKYYFAKIRDKYEYIFKASNVFINIESIEYSKLINLYYLSVDTNEGEIEYDSLSHIEEATNRQKNQLDICVDSSKWINIDNIAYWIYDIRKGDELTTKLEAEKNPYGVDTNGGLGYKPSMTFTVDRVNFYNTDTENPHAIIFPEGTHGIYHNSILPPFIKKFDEYKTKDYVVLVDKRPGNWNYEGKMDKFLGKVVHLGIVFKHSFQFKNDGKWAYKFNCIARYATKAEEKMCLQNDNRPIEASYWPKEYHQLGGMFKTSDDWTISATERLKDIYGKQAEIEIEATRENEKWSDETLKAIKEAYDKIEFNKHNYFKEEKDLSLEELIKKEKHG